MRSRQRGEDALFERAGVAMTLGVVAIPPHACYLSTADNAEEWGRDCTLHPESIVGRRRSSLGDSGEH